MIENSERNHRLVYRINPEIVFRVDFFLQNYVTIAFIWETDVQLFQGRSLEI